MGISAISLEKEILGNAVQLKAEVALDLGETLRAEKTLEGSLTAVIEQEGFGCSFGPSNTAAKKPIFTAVKASPLAFKKKHHRRNKSEEILALSRDSEYICSLRYRH